jgi:hypothetical protein
MATAYIGPFAKLWKVTHSFIMSVDTSHCLHGTALPHWTDFYEIGYWSIFRKSVKKIQVKLKLGKNERYFT